MEDSQWRTVPGPRGAQALDHRFANLESDSDEEFVDHEPDVELDEDLNNCLVVDNIPVIGDDKYDKLCVALKKKFATAGKLSEVGMFIPQDKETKKTKGYCFVEYITKEEALKAARKLDGLKLDKKHAFKVNLLTDYDRLQVVPEEYQLPQKQEHEGDENLYDYIMDKRARNQYIIHYGNTSEVCWNDGDKAEPIYARPNWTDTRVMWSPRGTYLLTFHSQGVAVWGGPSFKRLARFQHVGVKVAQFSPNENYLITCKPDDPEDPECVIIWDVRSRTKLRTFRGGVQTGLPTFKWSCDDKYLAKIGTDRISVYETPSMELLGKKSIEVAGVKDIAFSPTDPYLSYFVPEHGHVPASVTVIELPKKVTVGRKNLFNVVDVKMHWHPQGHFLAVKVDRCTTKGARKKKQAAENDQGAAAVVPNVFNFELFRLRDKNCPVESLELKDNVLPQGFGWEPKGVRFTVVTGETGRTQARFYTMGKAERGEVKDLHVLEKLAVNSVYWSPNGKFCLLAGLKSTKQTSISGEMVFYNADDNVIYRTTEHGMMCEAMWDPSGRYVCTSINHYRQTYQNEFAIWSITGKMLQRCAKDEFWAFLWRPRPASLLAPDQEKKIQKKYKEYQRKYDEEEAERERLESAEFYEHRARLREEFEAFLMEKRAEYAEQKFARMELRDGVDSDDEDVEEYDEEQEQVLNVTEEIVA